MVKSPTILMMLGIVVFACSTATHAAKQAPREYPTPTAYARMLGKGLDVDWLKTRQGRKYYNEQAVVDFKKQGVSHVRIRIMDEADKPLLSLMDKVVADCTKHGLIPVLAYQANSFKNKPDTKQMEKAVAWWKTVASHAQNYPATVSFDLIIEVTDALNHAPEILNRFYERAVSEIRHTNPERIVFISPRVRSAPEYLGDLKIPSAHNNQLMAEWHFYASGPDKKNANKQWTTGTEKERRIIRDKIALTVKWSRQNNIPTWVGAWMPGNYNKGNHFSIEEQRAFATFVACELDAAHIPFAVNSDVKFYDRVTSTWRSEMLPLLKDIIAPDCGGI